MILDMKLANISFGIIYSLDSQNSSITEFHIQNYLVYLRCVI